MDSTIEQILLTRELIIRFYKRLETPILFIIRFIVGMMVFNAINSLGLYRPEFASLLKAFSTFPATVFFGLLFAVMPLSIAYGLMAVMIALQISASTEIALLVFMFLLCLVFFYIRLSAKESVLVLATIYAFYFNIPYLIPLVAGLYFGLTAVIPVSIGIFVWNAIPFIKDLLSTTKTAGLNLMDMPATFGAVLSTITTYFSNNTQWMFVAFIFGMVIVVVHVVSLLSIDYSKELALGIGALLTIISFIIAVLVAGIETDIIGVVLFTIISAALAFLVRFFDAVLDYRRAERVEFEDEENYYFVKVIPKMAVRRKKRVVRRIDGQ